MTLSLENLCLATVISELEHYPVDLLALLPTRHRYRVLANLPILDLCCLEQTPLAEGVDMENIWRAKYPPWNELGGHIRPGPFDAHVLRHAKDKLHYRPYSSFTWRERYLYEVGTAMIHNDTKCFYEASYRDASCKDYLDDYCTLVIDWLVSVKGYQFLNEDGSLLDGHDWEQFSIPLMFFDAEHGKKYDRVMPPRYAHYKTVEERPTDNDLLSMIVHKCKFQPTYLNICIDPFASLLGITQKIGRPHIVKEFLGNVKEVCFHISTAYYDLEDQCKLFKMLIQFILSAADPKLQSLTLELPSNVLDVFSPDTVALKEACDAFISTLSPFLFTLPDITTSIPEGMPYRGLTSLTMKLPDLPIPLVNTLIESQTNLEKLLLHCSSSDKANAKLASLLSRLFLCPQFSILTLCNFNASLPLIWNIVYAFLVAPCTHQQILCFRELNIARSKCEDLQLTNATMPDSGLKFKSLLFDHLYSTGRQCQQNKRSLLSNLFRFPNLWLNSLCLSVYSPLGAPNVLNIAASNHNLVLRNLQIVNNEHLLEAQEDMASLHNNFGTLLQMSTLTEIELWNTDVFLHINSRRGTDFLPFLSALTQGLLKQALVGNLHRLFLACEITNYSVSELTPLFDALFSLPQVNEFTLEIFSDHLGPHTVEIMYSSWVHVRSGKCLKKLVCYYPFYYGLILEPVPPEPHPNLMKLAQEVVFIAKSPDLTLYQNERYGIEDSFMDLR